MTIAILNIGLFEYQSPMNSYYDITMDHKLICYLFQMIRNSINLISKKIIKPISSQYNPIKCMSSGATNLVNVDINDKTGIAVVTLNRPPVNSLNLELLQDISKTLDDLESNKSKGMILTSVGYFLH